MNTRFAGGGILKMQKAVDPFSRIAITPRPLSGGESRVAIPKTTKSEKIAKSR
jgi:hypothetical protein